MSNQKAPDGMSGLEEAIEETLTRMMTFNAEDKEYAQATDQLVKLYALKEVDRPWRPDANTCVLATANVLVTLLIVGYEQKDIITTKASNFLMKLR